MSAARIVASVSAVSVAVGLPLAAGVSAGHALASHGPGWSLLEGGIVALVAALIEVVAVSKFGGWVRRREAAQRLAARNARIRAYREGDPLEASAL